MSELPFANGNIPSTELLEQSINRWLKNKRFLAETVKDLPSKTIIDMRIENEVWGQIPRHQLREIRDFLVDEYLLKNPDLSRVSMGSTHGECAMHLHSLNSMNLFMLDFRMKGNTIEFFSYINNQVFLTFTLNEKVLGDPNDPDGDYNPHAYMSVSITGSFPTLNEFLTIGRKAIQMNFIERWKLGSIDFRRKNPICPYCGGAVTAYPVNRDTEELAMICDDNCGWTMKQRSHLTDIGEFPIAYVEDIFDKEVNYLKTKQNNDRKVNAEMSVIKNALQHISDLAKNDSTRKSTCNKELKSMMDKYLK